MRELPVIAATDLAVLRLQSMAALALWYCELNTWFWPAGLPDPPDDPYAPSGRRQSIMNWIGIVVGEYELSRFWNVEFRGGDHMSEKQFVHWWQKERWR